MASLTRFYEYLEYERRYSLNTVAAYQRDLELFCKLTELNEPAKATAELIQRFVAQLHARGLSPRSIARHLSSLRTYFKFCKRDNPSLNDPTASVKAPKPQRSCPKIWMSIVLPPCLRTIARTIPSHSAIWRC